jgi:GxxExxY protein
MIIELSKDEFRVEEEKPLQVYYDGQVAGNFFVDIFVNDAVAIELKSVQSLLKDHEVQLVNCNNPSPIKKIFLNA